MQWYQKAGERFQPWSKVSLCLCATMWVQLTTIKRKTKTSTDDRPPHFRRTHRPERFPMNFYSQNSYIFIQRTPTPPSIIHHVTETYFYNYCFVDGFNLLLYYYTIRLFIGVCVRILSSLFQFPSFALSPRFAQFVHSHEKKKNLNWIYVIFSNINKTAKYDSRRC